MMLVHIHKVIMFTYNIIIIHRDVYVCNVQIVFVYAT